MPLKLPEIADAIHRLAQRIEAPEHLLPTFGRTEDGGRPHLEVDERNYHFVVVERGVELERKTTPSIEELLYYVFASVTFALAGQKKTLPGKDPRRSMFARQVKLLSQLSPEWAQREAQAHEEILQRHPFRDAW